MDFFDVQLENKVLKRKNTFDQTYSYIKNNPIKTLNPGYYPPYNFLNKEDILSINNITLYLYLLENIETENKVLLDLCCGFGGGIDAYKKYFKLNKIYGIDYIEHAIEYCKNNCEGQFDVMDINNITYKPNYFDIITCIDSVQYSVEDFDSFSQTIYNLLKPNGIFAIAEFTLHNKDLKSLTNMFPNYKKIDITNNIHESCKNMLEQINASTMDEKHKKFFTYSYNENLKETQHVPFYKYIFYKGEQ